jgi:hypothetical protein
MPGRLDVKPTRMFCFEEMREAHRVMEAGEARGKMVVVQLIRRRVSDRPALALASLLH